MKETEEKKTRIERIRERRGGAQISDSRQIKALQMRRLPGQPKKEPVERVRNRRKRVPTRIFSALLLILVGGALGVYIFHPMFRVDRVNIYGMENINHDELIYFFGVKNLPIFMVDPRQMEQTVTERYEDVESASVRVRFPAVVDAYLEERLGVVEWDFGGSSFWLDKNGQVLSESRSQPDTIHVYADSYPGSLLREDRVLPRSFSKDTLRTMFRMAEALPEGKTLYYTYDNGYGWDTDEGYRLFLGKTDNDLDEKLRMAESLQAYFAEEDIQPVFLSVEFKDAPYYRFTE